jgi:hypothetical protein
MNLTETAGAGYRQRNQSSSLKTEFPGRVRAVSELMPHSFATRKARCRHMSAACADPAAANGEDARSQRIRC